MAKGLLSCLKKRDLIQEGSSDREALNRYGREYAAQGRSLEALEFFEQTRDEEGLRALKTRGLEEGDPFLFKQACRLLKEIPDSADWKTVGEKALAAGRTLQALAVFRSLGDDVRIGEVEKMVKELYQHDEHQS